MTPGFIALGILILIYLFLIFPGKAKKDEIAVYKGRNFAHRGLYDNKTNAPENSLAAFEAAMEAGYGCELDVQFTKDKKLIVFHDDDYKRVCGVDKAVWDMTYDEILELRLCGTDQYIPTFREVLDTVDGKNPLIVEIKASGLNTAWYKELCEATMAELETYPGQYCVESFNPYVVRWLKKHAPNITRGLLVEGRVGEDNKNEAAINFVAELLVNFYCRPQFIAYNCDKRNLALRIAQKLGAFTVMWTCRTPEHQAELEQKEDCIIFENYRPDTRFQK